MEWYPRLLGVSGKHRYKSLKPSIVADTMTAVVHDIDSRWIVHRQDNLSDRGLGCGGWMQEADEVTCLSLFASTTTCLLWGDL